MATLQPEIAVVISTRGRETRLAFALEALAGQDLDRKRFEVIVVRDEDASGPFAVAPEGLSVRFMKRPGIAGPSAKRNHGWRSAKAGVVAFTDDDCRPSPQWLGHLVAAAAGHVFVQGPTEPDPDEVHLLHGLARSQSIDEATGWFQTCNMAYPRRLLERLGGFDESFSFGGEDTDLAYRAMAAGARLRFADEALVWHAVMARSLPQAFREARRWSDLPAVVARHPGLRRFLYRGVFWNKGHAALPLAVVGLALARRHPALAVAACSPYLDFRLNLREPSARRIAYQLASLPAWAAFDATEIATRLPAAIRHRVLVV